MVFLTVCGGLAVLDAERENPEANITSFGDALWWAVTTITTVGYGDRFPTTPTGRLVAVALMVGGIALLGVLTAALASWFVEQVQAGQSTTTTEYEHVRSEIAELTREVIALRAQLGNRTDQDPVAPRRYGLLRHIDYGRNDHHVPTDI